MIKKDLYVLVDHNINNVISHPIELPENWNNIHGLHSLSDIELSNFEWAGHSNLGWVKFNSEFPSTYAFSDNWESFARLSIKEIYSNQRCLMVLLMMTNIQILVYLIKEFYIIIY